eukprot:14607931-Ditylum_brightwellii.AAC.1
MASDVMHNLSPIDPNQPSAWHSPISRAVDNTTCCVIQTVTGADTLPEYSFHLAILPSSANGFGIYTPSTSAITSFVIPLIR